MSRSSDWKIRSSGTPRSRSASTVKWIITSGPQTKAVTASARNSAVATSFGTTPTLPFQLVSAASTVTSTARVSRQLSSWSV